MMTGSVPHILYHVTILPLLAVTAFLYYNLLLLRLPSLPYFQHCAERKIAITSTSYPEDDRSPTSSTVPDLWSKSCTLCRCILIISFIAQPFYMNTAMIVLAGVTGLCSIFAIALSMQMRWHLLAVQEQSDARTNWLALTSKRKQSRFVATPMLLAAPVAWAVWAFAVASVLACLTTWGSDGTTFERFNLEQLPALFANIAAFADGPCESSLSGSPTTQQETSLLATLPVAILLVFGVAHMCFVMVSFSYLGFALPHSIEDGDPNDQEIARSMTVWSFTRENNMSSSDDGADGTSVNGSDSMDGGSLSPTRTFVDDDQISMSEYGYVTAIQSPV